MADTHSKSHTYGFEGILPRRFSGHLSEAEKRLLHAVQRGELAICGPNRVDGDPANDPATVDNWGSEREIRADIIGWLCTDEEASKRVTHPGVQAYGAKITGRLDLSFATVPFRLSLNRCHLTDNCYLRYVRVPYLSLSGTSTQSVDAAGADIGGNLVLGLGFSAHGEVRLQGAQIGGALDCGDGSFKNSGGYALNANRAEIKGTVFLKNASTEGEVNLTLAHVGSNLECDGAHFRNPSDWALAAEGAEIKGSVRLRDVFAEGEVNLLGSQIGGELDCSHGRFTTLNFESLAVRRALVWRRMEDFEELDLQGATVGFLSDDEASWPRNKNLDSPRRRGIVWHLDNFVYGGIAGGPTDAPTRLKWLGHQGKFTPQPYRQLAKIMRELGDEEGAKQVLFDLESRTRAEVRRRLIAPLRWLRFAEDTVSDAAVGYGIYPGRAIWYLGALTALGWIVHRRAQRAGAMVPTDKDAYAEFHASGHAPDHYPPFSPLVYSLENCLPLVKFGQDDHWQPDPTPQPRVNPPSAAAGWRARLTNLLFFHLPNRATSAVALRWFRWVMIALGWLLATFFAAAVTGIIKSGS